MGFKTDTSFLQFLSIGAAGVHQTINQLKSIGFHPIELERYCGSNKIWATKVKRLRLPDLLCVRTGLRIEVRAKSNLKIRMSDAPNNPDRHWDAGLRDDDLVAFIASFDNGQGPQTADEALFFTVRSLRDSVNSSKLGQPKSASEGAERDRTWPATIPNRSGVVLEKDNQRLIVQMQGDGKPPRRQTYRLNGKKAYVSPGDTFTAKASILAGTPDHLADVRAYLHHQYDPLNDLSSPNPVDRYAAAKSLPYREDLKIYALPALENLISEEIEERVHLEASGSAAALGSGLGEERIRKILHEQGSSEMRMEAVFILTELNNTFAREELSKIAGDRELFGNELRQAAIWGLGKSGLKAYDKILPFIDDEDENLALHAIAAFGTDTPRNVIDTLVHNLQSGKPRKAAAASEALRIVGSGDVLESLISTVNSGQSPHEWVLTTLGRLPATMVKQRLHSNPLLNHIKPLLLLSEEENWLSTEELTMDILFLLKQNI